MPVAYVPVTQVNDGFLRVVHGWFEPTFIVRSALPFAETAGIMRRSLDATDPLLPFAGVRAMSEVKALSLGEQRFLMALLVSLAAAAIALAAVGIHGLIAASVAERTREMGIRMALGATVSQAMHAIAVPGIVLAAIGTGVGLAAASASTRLIRHFVWGVTPNDPLTFVSVAAALLAVATAASFIPALRLLRLDPATTLRQD
jgi:predicted lysophospholipase L1 biosynthesis ABC-type transport system permease subunit